MENKSIRKQVQEDSPNKSIGWEDPMGPGSGPVLFRLGAGISGFGGKSIQSERWVPDIQQIKQFGVKPNLAPVKS